MQNNLPTDIPTATEASGTPEHTGQPARISAKPEEALDNSAIVPRRIRCLDAMALCMCDGAVGG